MCKAHVQRFRCGHGILMGIEPCIMCPCPSLKTTGVKLPQQPFKCYNCQYKSSSPLSPTSSRDTSCSSSIGSVESNSSYTSTSSYGTSSTIPSPTLVRMPTHPLPGVARQPTGSVQYCRNLAATCKPSVADKHFSFSCSSSNHYPAPHYTGLPSHLPHQDHPCPPCQIDQLRQKSDREAISAARREFPHLTGEMLVRNGRSQAECEWTKKMTLDRYMEEKRSDEKQMWLHVVRKWTQDLRKCRVLVAEEDGLGLLS